MVQCEMLGFSLQKKPVSRLTTKPAETRNELRESLVFLTPCLSMNYVIIGIHSFIHVINRFVYATEKNLRVIR